MNTKHRVLNIIYLHLMRTSIKQHLVFYENRRLSYGAARALLRSEFELVEADAEFFAQHLVPEVAVQVVETCASQEISVVIYAVSAPVPAKLRATPSR
ncbi:hypothetical protein RA27_18830 [Ruegeria sp. ANG-R]|nr:hypothetical protein RA27_18830 [Ruegeria sp. ANG-R]